MDDRLVAVAKSEEWRRSKATDLLKSLWEELEEKKEKVFLMDTDELTTNNISEGFVIYEKLSI